SNLCAAADGICSTICASGGHTLVLLPKPRGLLSLCGNLPVRLDSGATTSMKTAAIAVLTLGLCIACAAGISAQPLLQQPCAFEWDYDEASQVALFLMFVRPEAGQYDFDRPAFAADAKARRIGCEEIALMFPTPGVYGAVLIAVNAQGNRSDPSTE